MSRWWELALVCALCVSFAGCFMPTKEPRLELIDAFLRTPEAEVPVSQVGKPGLAISGGTESLSFTIGLFSPSPILIVSPKPRTRPLEFDMAGCFYQLNGGEKRALCAEALKRVDDLGKPRSPMLALDLPPSFSGLNFSEYKTSEAEIETFEAMSGDLHRLYIPFRVDGEPYVIDVSFELDVETEWDFHVTSSMP